MGQRLKRTGYLQKVGNKSAVVGTLSEKATQLSQVTRWRKVGNSRGKSWMRGDQVSQVSNEMRFTGFKLQAGITDALDDLM